MDFKTKAATPAPKPENVLRLGLRETKGTAGQPARTAQDYGMTQLLRLSSKALRDAIRRTLCA
jgi:hypothetical protein